MTSSRVLWGAHHMNCNIRSNILLQCRQRLLCQPLVAPVSQRPTSTNSAQRNAPPKKYNARPSQRAPPVTPISNVTKQKVSQEPHPYPLTQTDDLSSLLNPPSSSRPPPLHIPPKDDSLPKYKSLFRLGKAYLTFYKTGFKQITRNFAHVRSLPIPWYSRHKSLLSALKDNRISRAQYHLLLRFRSDARRLPLFALVFLACGEFTPLLVPFLSPIVPRTLWLPGQVEKGRKKREERLGEERRTYGRETFKLLKQLPAYAPEGGDERALMIAGARLGAWGRVLDPFVRNKIVPSGIVRGWVEATAEELRLDDWALERDGGTNGLVGEEVSMAVETRGIDVRGRTEVELRMLLTELVEVNRKAWSEEMEEWLRIEKIGQRKD